MRRTGSILLGAVTIAALLVTPGAATGSTSPTTTDFIDSNWVDITSSTGQPLELAFFVQPKADLEIQVRNDAGEDHEWDIPVNAKTFTYDSTTVTGSIDTRAKDMGPLGTVNLTIASAGDPIARDCGALGSRTRQPVTLTGTMFFNTGSATWGSLGDAASTSFTTPAFVEENDTGKACFRSKPPCAGAVEWNDAGGLHGGFNGYSFVNRSGNHKSQIQFETSQTIAHPDDVQRDDTDAINVPSPALTTNARGDKAVRVKGPETGLITGTARLVSTGKPSTVPACRGGDTKVWPARYIPGSNPLTLHPAIGRVFTQKLQKKGAYISRDDK